MNVISPARKRHDSPARQAAAPCFRLDAPGESVVAHGVAHRFVEAIPDGSGPELLARLGGDGAHVLVGALPFDPERGACLVRPSTWQRARSSPGAVDGPGRAGPLGAAFRVQPVPTREGYAQMVREALRQIQGDSGRASRLRKVVLARELRVEADREIDPERVFAALQNGRATTFSLVLPPSESGESRVLVGASPELLVEKRGTVVTSNPLAGSAPRHPDPEQDRAAAEALLASAKDLREHRMVVEHVRDTLAGYCRALDVDETPQLTSTDAMWHLATRVKGTLRDPATCSLELARALHPTPAVCGAPTEDALRSIDRLEPFDRGFYAGAVGWVDASGDGRWMVTIRCAEITGRTGILRAGAGIVAGSDPETEAAETSAKFVTLLRALGIDEHGTPLEGTTT